MKGSGTALVVGGKESASSVGAEASVSDQGTKIPHDVGQLTPRTTTNSPQVTTKTRHSQIIN